MITPWSVMRTKTCMQRVLVRLGPRRGQIISRRRPHAVPVRVGSDGYEQCAICGATVYIRATPGTTLQEELAKAAIADRSR